MDKKNAEREKDEDQDLEDEDEDEVEDEGDEEDEEEHAASAKPAGEHRPRPRARAAHDDDHEHDDDDHHGDHADGEEDDESLDDPYWWTPHAVMSVLVLIGVLGFFGAFNRLVGHAPVATTEEKTASEKPAAAAAAAAAAAKPAEQREEYGAKHLLVQYKGAMRAPASITRTEEEAKARATEAMKKAKGGTAFEDLVKEYSDEPGAGQRGGDLGRFRKGQMVPEFQNAVEKMKVGEISDLVKTPFGYHVIKRTH